MLWFVINLDYFSSFNNFCFHNFIPYSQNIEHFLEVLFQET